MTLFKHNLVDVLALAMFTFVFLAQLVRVAMGWSMQIGPYPVPVFVSYVAILMAGFLTYAFIGKVLSEQGVIG